MKFEPVVPMPNFRYPSEPTIVPAQPAMDFTGDHDAGEAIGKIYANMQHVRAELTGRYPCFFESNPGKHIAPIPVSRDPIEGGPIFTEETFDRLSSHLDALRITPNSAYSYVDDAGFMRVLNLDLNNRPRELAKHIEAINRIER